MKSKYTATKLACYVSCIVQAIINNFLAILFIAFQNVYGLSYEKLARLLVFNFATQIFTDLATPKIAAVLGYRKTAVLCQASAATGLALLGFLPRIMNDTYLAIIICIIIYAFGSGLMEVIMSPMIEMLPTSNKTGNMAFLHSFYCWGQMFTVIGTTLMVLIFGYKDWYFIPIIWSIIPFLNMFSFVKVPIVEPDSEHKQFTFKQLYKLPKFKAYMLMMLCAGASEIAMAEWASLFAQQSLGVNKIIGDLAGPCAFAFFMGLGRVIYAGVAKKVSFKAAVVSMSAICFVCYMVVAFCGLPWLSLIFCALCGFTVSLFWPGIYSAGAVDFPYGSAVMFCVFALCGDVGCSLGPWVLGIVADSVNLNIAFAVAGVFPLIMLVTAVFSLKNNDCKLEQ